MDGLAVCRRLHTTINGTVSAPGEILLRVHYNPYWKLTGAGCA